MRPMIKNAFKVFSIYRLGDVGLILAVSEFIRFLLSLLKLDDITDDEICVNRFSFVMVSRFLLVFMLFDF